MFFCRDHYKVQKTFFLNRSPQRCFTQANIIFFWLSYHVMFCCCGHDKTQKKPKSTLSKVFCWRTYRFFVSKIAVNQWWLRKKNKWCIFLFPKSQFQRYIPLRGPWVKEFRAKSMKPPAKHLWNDRFRMYFLYFSRDHDKKHHMAR